MMTEIGKVHKAYRTLMQMLTDRGYKISDIDTNISLSDFKDQKMENNGSSTVLNSIYQKNQTEIGELALKPAESAG